MGKGKFYLASRGRLLARRSRLFSTRRAAKEAVRASPVHALTMTLTLNLPYSTVEHAALSMEGFWRDGRTKPRGTDQLT